METTQFTKTDTEFIVAGITYTAREWRTENGEFHRGDLFAGGWRMNTYHSESGFNRAVRITRFGNNLGGIR